MTQLLKSKTETVHINQIDTKADNYAFRIRNVVQQLTLKRDLQKLGQLYPITLEPISSDRYRIIDGFRRIQAIKQLKQATGASDWDQIACDVLDPSKTNEATRFILVRNKNFSGSNPYGLFEKSACINYFYRSGLSPHWLSNQSRLSFHQIEDLLTLAQADAIFAPMLNKSQIDPVFAAMLFRRYQSWIQTPFKKQAFFIAKKLLSLPSKEKLTMKIWRFYLDFYWENNRPSMVNYK